MCEIGYKKCCKCVELKSLDLFNKDSRKKDGLQTQCKSCSKRYYEANRERLKDYRRLNSEKYKSTVKKWQQSNPDKHNVKNSKRRAKKKGLTHPNHNPAIERTLHQIAARLTSCLGVNHEVDHIWPLAKGGYHHHENLQVITQSVNQQKSASLDFYHPSIKTFLDLPKWLQKEIIVKSGKIHYDEIKAAIASMKG